MVREASHHICSVGEVKTPWTFKQRDKDPDDFETWLAGKFGTQYSQLVLSDLACRF